MSTKSQQERVKANKIDNHMLDIHDDSNDREKPLDSLITKDNNETEDDAYPTVEEWLAMPDNEKLNVLHDSLLELYLNVKIRNFDKTIDSEKVDDELDKLK